MKNRLFKQLVYVYIGTSDFAADFHFYQHVLNAELVWEFSDSEAKVAAFDLCGKPYLLIADHTPAPAKRLIYEVEDIHVAAEELRAKGWIADGKMFEVPDGPCINFKDKSENQYAILQMTRPYILEKEYKKKNPETG